jgi:putative transposase
MNIMNENAYARLYPDFITVTCLDWIPLLKQDRFKDIIMDSLSFLTQKRRVRVYGFVIMSNHFHLIWQMLGTHTRENVQRDFLKFTGQQILKILKHEKSSVLNDLLVQAKDREHQIWERNSLSIPLWTEKVLWQKLEYIHYNPVRAGLCKYPEDYRYSSAGFYYKSDRYWDFLVHCDG